MQEKQRTVTQQQAQLVLQEKLRHEELARHRADWHIGMAGQSTKIVNQLLVAQAESEAGRQANCAAECRVVGAAGPADVAQRQVQRQPLEPAALARDLLIQLSAKSANLATWRER